MNDCLTRNKLLTYIIFETDNLAVERLLGYYTMDTWLNVTLLRDYYSLYDSTITVLLDRQVPARSVTCRRRPSSLWFDDECRMAKRNVRRLERAARREGPLASSSSSTATAWRAQRRAYFDYCNGSSTRTGQSALMLTIHIRVDCGGPSMNC